MQQFLDNKNSGNQKKAESCESRPDPISPLYFRSEDKQGGPTAIIYGFDEAFNFITNQHELKYSDFTKHPLYIELSKKYKENIKTFDFIGNIGNTKTVKPPNELAPIVANPQISEIAPNLGDEKLLIASKPTELKPENNDILIFPMKPQMTFGNTLLPELNPVLDHRLNSNMPVLNPLINIEEGKKLNNPNEVKKENEGDFIELNKDANSKLPNRTNIGDENKTKGKKCDEIFAEYLNYVSKNVKKSYYKQVVKFVLLYREYFNETGKKIAQKKEGLPDIITDQKEELEFDYCLISDATYAPEICNDFITEFLDHIKPNFIELNPIEITQNLCHWLFMNEYTCSRISLLETNS